MQTTDTASTNYGLKDGLSLCGSRTYSVSYVFNGAAITPAFITSSGSVLTIYPTLSS
jgi:hypothetical protein